MNHTRSMQGFDPRLVARYEKENYVAYYQKRWLKLLQASVGMVKEAFGLSPWQAVYAAYLVARAEIAFAPFPDNDLPTAESYMRRFYTFIKEIHRADFDVERAARLDVRWWVVHRQLFGQAENQPLVEALMDLYAVVYGVEPERVRLAAQHRAQGMLYSDLWVNGGRPDAKRSPLLAQEEEALVKSYAALREAVGGEQQERREPYPVS